MRIFSYFTNSVDARLCPINCDTRVILKNFCDNLFAEYVKN